MVISGLDVEERKTLDILLTKLRQFVEQTGVGVIAISHLRRNNTKTSFNRAGEVDLNDLRGSASLEQLSDVVLSVERNQMDEDRDKAEVSQLRLLKNRPFGQTGPVGFVKYDRHTGRLKHFDQDMPVDVEDFEVPFLIQVLPRHLEKQRMNGKGDKQRPTNKRAFDLSFDRIFGALLGIKKAKPPNQQQQVFRLLS